MIIASIINEEVCSFCTMMTDPLVKSIVISKNTVHKEQQYFHQETAEKLKTQFKASKSVIRWGRKLLADLSSKSTENIDRFAVLVSSLQDKSTKLLGVPKLLSGICKAAADAVFELLTSWKCESQVIGMCYDTTNRNSGRFKGVSTLLEQKIGRNLFWMACQHHMFEALFSDAFRVCFGHLLSLKSFYLKDSEKICLSSTIGVHNLFKRRATYKNVWVVEGHISNTEKILYRGGRG